VTTDRDASRPSSYSFPQRLRLKTADQFRIVYEHRTSRSSGPLTAYAIPNDLEHCRLGLSVPRRVGTASRRNRVKRLLRESFRLMQHDLPGGYDVVINVRPHEPMALAEYQHRLAKAMRLLHETWKNRADKKGRSA
jgi:ribonuclease P protein component